MATHDDEMKPTPEEKRRLLSEVPGDTGLALRLVVALVEADARCAKAVLDEAQPRVLYVTSTLGVIAAWLAHALVTQVGGDASTWVHGAAMAVMDDVDQALNGEAEQ